MILSSLLLLIPSAGPAQDPPAGAAPAPEAERPAPPASAFAVPLYLDPLPPPLRSARHVHVLHSGVPGLDRKIQRSPEEARELAEHVVALLRAGGDFEALAAEYSAARNAGSGAVLGTFPEGLLAGPLDRFLFQAEIGEISDPLETGRGYHVLQRIETLAATRHLLVRGAGEEARAKAQGLLERIRAGEDFAELARRHSDDPFSRDRGGLFTLFERGPDDRLLKAAAFAAEVGETVGPIESSAGYHLIQRVPVEGHPEDLRETTMVRVRAILLSFDDTPLGGITANRPLDEAERLAFELRDRIRSGEDMAELARRFNDDLGGKQRAGDLGWIHRRNPRIAGFLDPCFMAEPGELLDPLLTNLGWVVLRREL